MALSAPVHVELLLELSGLTRQEILVTTLYALDAKNFEGPSRPILLIVNKMMEWPEGEEEVEPEDFVETSCPERTDEDSQRHQQENPEEEEKHEDCELSESKAR